MTFAALNPTKAGKAARDFATAGTKARAAVAVTSGKKGGGFRIGAPKMGRI